MSCNDITHDKGGLDLVQTMKRTREALVVPEIPRHHDKILPSIGGSNRVEGWG
jgi:hypothetical protein